MCEMSKAHVCMNADDGAEGSSLIWCCRLCSMCVCVCVLGCSVINATNEICLPHHFSINYILWPLVELNLSPISLDVFHLESCPHLSLRSHFFQMMKPICFVIGCVRARCEHEPRHLNLFYYHTCLRSGKP